MTLICCRKVLLVTSTLRKVFHDSLRNHRYFSLPYPGDCRQVLPNIEPGQPVDTSMQSYPVWSQGLQLDHCNPCLSCLCLLWHRARQDLHVVKGDERGQTVHIHTIVCFLWLTICLVYVFGTVWPVMCWSACKTCQNKTSCNTLYFWLLC